MSTTIWTGLVNSNWGDLLNWDNGVPTAADDAVFDASSSATCYLDADAVCKTLDFTGFTGEFGLGGWGITISGNLTLSVWATYTDVYYWKFDANATITTAGVIVKSIEPIGAITLTLGDDLFLEYNLIFTTSGASLAFGVNSLYLGNSSGDTFFHMNTGVTATYSAGATIEVGNTTPNSLAYVGNPTTTTLPPININNPGAIAVLYDASGGSAYTSKFESVTLIAGTASFGNEVITTGNMTLNDGAFLTFAGGGTHHIGGNFDSSVDMNGASTETIIVTGTAVSHDSTITDMSFAGGTELDATDNNVDGGGNTNINFAGGSSLIGTLRGLAIASVKNRNGLAIASVKSINGLANV